MIWQEWVAFRLLIRSFPFCVEGFSNVAQVPDKELLTEYIGVRATLAIQQEDEDWSREVLDISCANSRDYLEEYLNESARHLPARTTLENNSLAERSDLDAPVLTDIFYRFI